MGVNGGSVGSREARHAVPLDIRRFLAYLLPSPPRSPGAESSRLARMEKVGRVESNPGTGREDDGQADDGHFMNKTWIFTLSRWIVLALARLWFRIEFEGTEYLPKTGAFLLTPNHVSYFDPFWVSLPVSRPMRYMTWDEMTRKPVIGPLMRAYGAFPVDIRRGDRTALRRAADQLHQGGGLVIFPEGGRTSTGELMPFKPGAILLALEAGVPIIPATIQGGYEAYSRHHLFPRPRKVRVRYHPPLLVRLPPGEEVSKEFLRQQAARLREVVASGLARPAA